VGAAVAAFCVAAARNPRLLPARFLTLRPVLLLGAFSYSLYLVHEPPVALLGALLNRAHAGVAVSATAWAALIVLVVALAYALYLVLERPYLSGEARAAKDRETAVVPFAADAVLAVDPAA
jgi:peptidoglycan/LPS O-acetylase OafA/YrhL